MALKCGIVGLPNIGKSTLFNALTASCSAEAANYPFCTIEPNNGTVEVPDTRLTRLAKLANSANIIPAHITFVDIAGLVKGASQGEGLGNKFLSHIREVDAIIHVLRCFTDHNISHVHNKIDPLYDAEIIATELMIADLNSIERRLVAAQKRLKSDDKMLKEHIRLLTSIHWTLSRGEPIKKLINPANKKEVSLLQLLTLKPTLYVCNVLESEAGQGNQFTKIITEKARAEQTDCIIMSAKIEAEISLLETLEERQAFLNSLNLSETGLAKVIKAAYKLLDLQSFFTIGPSEAHAWTFKAGTLASQAAGIIHTDFAKGFIKAEVISYEDYIAAGTDTKAKAMGKMRLEGKEYKVQDGDVIHFRFNV